MLDEGVKNKLINFFTATLYLQSQKDINGIVTVTPITFIKRINVRSWDLFMAL